MAASRFGFGSMLLVIVIVLVVMPGQAAAFGAGNIPSIAQVEGHNWRHGDIEDMLKTIAFLHGKKWTTLLVQRTYFGNWLRDYSQAVDVGSLKGVNAETIRVLVWILSFLANGYATEEFEVTSERLGVYRPEEHIDNPLGYADGKDAREFDKRLRGPVLPVETEIDMRTGMKNYIANETGGWATSAGYLRNSIARSVHYGRLYTSGSSRKGDEDDLCEALRCLGQSLHCMEDFSAHSNYCELALRELGYNDVYPHCGTNAQIRVNGKHIYPIVTGTFGGVDFLHSVLGEANDHLSQSEVDEMNSALLNAQMATKGEGGASRGLGGGPSNVSSFISLVSKLPVIGGGFASEALAGQIYPILKFRDKIVKSINRGIAKIPGLESLLEHISETLTAFVLGLLAPFIRPIINQVTKVLKDGSSGVIATSANAQLEPWRNPNCTDPTHSMLSKDHFTNILNSCAGRVAATVLQYAVPRILYAWENPGVPVDETVRKWADEYPRKHELNHILGSQSVKDGKNHILQGQDSNRGHSHGGGIFDSGSGNMMSNKGHGRPTNSLWSKVATRDLDAMGAGQGGGVGYMGASSPAEPAQTPSARPPGSFGYKEEPRPATGGAADSFFSGGGGGGGGSGGYQGQPPPAQYGGGPQGYGHYHQHQPPPQGYGGPPPQQGTAAPRLRGTGCRRRKEDIRDNRPMVRLLLAGARVPLRRRVVTRVNTRASRPMGWWWLQVLGNGNEVTD
ncbi:heterokaryon incompatibility Het-C protein [Apiospora arundinis]